MQGRTHAAAGLAIGLVLISAAEQRAIVPPVTREELYGYGLLCTVLGGLFPDIDLPTSMIGNKVKFLSSILRLLFGHRTFFHAPLVYTAVFVAVSFTWPQYQFWEALCYVGVASHLMLDMMTEGGIPLFYPFKARKSKSYKRYHICRWKSGGVGERLVRLVCDIGSAYYAYLFLLQL